MKLEYKILWIEDDENWLRVPLKKIEQSISDYGFIPKIDVVLDCDVSSYDLFNYDMIFVDYNLDKCTPKQYGDKILSELQSKKIYADSIFYSSSNIDDLYSKVKESDLINVSVLPRDVFKSENIKQVLNIIGYFLKKELDLNTMRGIMMSEVAHFDNRIWELLEKVQTKEEIIKFVRNKKNEQKENFDKCTDENLWNELSNKNTSTINLTSASRGSYLKKTMMELFENNDSYLENINILKNYRKEIIDVRNSLAHRENIEADDEKSFIAIRKNIIKHQINLENINNKIQGE